MSVTRPKPVDIEKIASELEERDVNFGAQIRDLRKARGLTIQGLSDATGFSIGYLSQLERNVSKLSIDGLVKISEALDVSMHWFFTEQGDDDGKQRVVVRSRQRRRMEYPNLGVQEELLSPSLTSPIELLRSTIEPHAKSGEKSYSHVGYEVGVILSGRLNLWVDGEKFELAAGDSFGFSSKQRHRFENPTDKKTIVIWAVTPPTF
ncbi:MAG: cupin domain-containing protein [Pseudomonadota bacterium]